MNYFIAIDDQPIDSAIKEVESIGMKIHSWSADHISCEGGYMAGARLRVLCENRGWRVSTINRGINGLAAFIVVLLLLALLLSSLYGTIVMFRCHREAFGSHITVGEITVLAIVTWFGLVSLLAAASRS